MKKIIAVALCLLLCLTCVACKKPTPEENVEEEFGEIHSELVLTKENFPKLDGSTANLPLAYMLVRYFLGMTQEEAENYIVFNTTDIAYYNLCDFNLGGFDSCDLVLAYEASQSTKKNIAGTKLTNLSIGRDALVFLVNNGNAVDSLTHTQLVDIYSGKITNWKDVGGADKEIVAFQRQESSGSQTMMQKLVMSDTPMMEAPTKLVSDTMNNLIEVLDEYRNEANAIGYSVFYYANYMYSNPNLKFLAVGGVMPSNETIGSGEYPFVNDFYAVFRSDEPADSPARLLAEWLTTPDGKALIALAGYVTTP